MVEQYLGARLFVSPSMIENSSNSVCEAQLVGTPVVASLVGGTMDLVTHRHTGLLYRFEETAQLADYICELLGDDDLCCRLSDAERQTALARHDRTAIAHALMQIYEDIHAAQ
jgi:glycosyltransferase involved in cell wall biosynthesis